MAKGIHSRTVRGTFVAAALLAVVASPAGADEPKPAPPAPAKDAPKPKQDADADPPLDAAAQKAHDEQVAFWVKRLRTEKNREMVRQQIENLGQEKSRAARDALIEFTKGNSNQEFVKHAFDALARIRGKTVVEFLCGRDALASRDFFVALSAAEALGSIGDRRAVDPLMEVVDSKTVKIEVQGACLQALASCGKGDAAAEDALFRYAEAKGDTVRANALEALGRLGADDAVKVLAKHLKDEKNTRCRGAAATGLGRTGRKDAIPYLQAALDDEALTVRECVRSALSSLGRTAK
jgi:HEAT repeat protein